MSTVENETNVPTPDQWAAAIAIELQLAITEVGTTNKAVSEASGVKYQTLGRYLRGDRELRTGVLAAICRSIPIEPWDLWQKAGTRLGVSPSA